MARLKIGPNIEFKAELPKLDQQSPKIGPAVVEKEEPKQAFDLLAVVEQIKNLMPQEEPTPVVDLSHVDEKLLDFKQELSAAVSKLSDQHDHLQNRIDNLSMSLDHLNEEMNDLKSAEIIIPEVKNITHVKDVSPEVLDHCKSLIKSSQNDIMLKVQDLQKMNRKQAKLNRVLAIALIITIFLHLI